MFGFNGFILLHIGISLIAIGAGFVVVGGFLTRSTLRGSTHVFLAASVASSATGLMFPFTRFMPSHAIAIISLAVLAVALYAYYSANLTGRWSRIFVGAAVAALYLNVFVLIAQTFAKNPALVALAPTQSELPFALAQTVALLIFSRLGLIAVRRTASPVSTVA